jgi:cytochrome c oxidase subunit II
MAVVSARKSARPAKAVRCAGLVLGAGMPGPAAAFEWNLQPAVSSIAPDIHGLHEYVILFVTVLLVGVFGFMFYSVFVHRNSKGDGAKQFHESTTVEIVWTVIPAVILIAIAWPVAKTVVAHKDTSNANVAIKVIGMQWKRGYDHIKGEGRGISFASATTTPRDQIGDRAPGSKHYRPEVGSEMGVPVGKTVRMPTTSGGKALGE